MSNHFMLKLTNPRGSTVAFLFDDENQCMRNYAEIASRMKGESLEEARGVEPPLNSSFFEVRDGYGNVALIDCNTVEWMWITNTAKDLEGQKELAFQQAHANANFQRRCQADQLLRGVAATPPLDLSQMPPRRN